MRKLSVDLTGQRFGTRLVLGFAKRSKNGGHAIWHVHCDCGREYECLSQTLRNTKACSACNPILKELRPYRRKRPYEALYNGWKNKLDKLSKHQVFLNYDEFVKFTQIKECHYCGAYLCWTEYRQKGQISSSASNLDRKDSNLPYTLENVVACCRRCNIGKNVHFTYDEWKAIGNLIKTWRADAASKEQK